MRQRQKIINALTEGGELTQGDLSIRLYGDNKHMPNIYASLMGLVNSGMVIRRGLYPSYYSLSGADIRSPERTARKKRIQRHSDLAGIGSPLDIKSAVDIYLEVMDKDPNARFVSFEHFHRAFVNEYKKPSHSDEDIDRLALHLFAYLCSWGMLRASFLLQKDYLFHRSAMKLLLDKQYERLLDIDIDDLDGGAISLVLGLKERIGHSYRGKTYRIDNNGVREEPINGATDTLATKILMGSFACVSAYDRYFVKGIANAGICQSFVESSINGLLAFYKGHKEEIDGAASKSSRQRGIHYTEMKILDMYFWVAGLKDS